MDNEQKNISPIGFCTECGITVNAENCGATSPKVMCKTCLERKKTAEAVRINGEREVSRKSLTARFILSTLAAIFVGAAGAYVGLGNSIGLTIGMGAFGAYLAFALVFCLMSETAVGDVVSWMCSRAISWPGLIFEWDLDGIIWVICMKLLFAVIGFLFGVLMAVLGLCIGAIMGIFIFPFALVSEIREHRSIG